MDVNELRYILRRQDIYLKKNVLGVTESIYKLHKRDIAFISRHKTLS